MLRSVPVWNEENVLKLGVMVVAQLSVFTKKSLTVHLRWRSSVVRKFYINEVDLNKCCLEKYV